MKGTFRQIVDSLRQRKKAYMAAFGIPGSPGFEALADLAKFCRAFSPEQFPLDHDRALVAAGRREAFFRIYQHINLEPEELAALYRKVVIQPQDEAA